MEFGGYIMIYLFYLNCTHKFISICVVELYSKFQTTIILVVFMCEPWFKLFQQSPKKNGRAVYGAWLGGGVPQTRQHALMPPNGLSDAFTGRRLGNVDGHALRLFV
jgi:hypothetical protein